MAIDVGGRQSDVSGSSTEEFLADPSAFFSMSYTAMHSVPRHQMEELQLKGLAFRLEQQIDRVAMLSKLAKRQGIASIERVEDIVPLLFEHTMYKSYPLALLERQQFVRLTDWLAKLTSIDISQVDASGCDSIDSWLDVVAQESQLDLSRTSGTTGTMSFIPWSRRDFVVRARFTRVHSLQCFGEPPTSQEIEAPYHLAVRTNLQRSADYLGEVITRNEPGHIHHLTSRPSADLLWLAARIRMAAARGDVSNVEVPASLLARRGELEQLQGRERDLVENWRKEIGSLQGELMLWNVFPVDLYAAAAPRVEAGERWTYAPGSAVIVMGGTKGQVLPPDWMETAKRFLEARLAKAYGMTELTGLSMMCSAGRYHINPWVIPYVLDPDSSALLPRRGVQVGRYAFFDLLTESHWGGLMTGDEVEVDFEGQCACGATTQHIAADVARLSEKRGGDDKISCTATPQAYEEAMEFLTSY